MSEGSDLAAVSWCLTGPFLYLAAAVFVAGATRRVVSLLRMPRHLRWELYPIPHGGPAGSKYERVDFAGSPPHRSLLREIAFMVEEVFLLKRLFLSRRSLWLGSWLLHAGLYLCTVFLGLLGTGALVTLLGFPPSAEAGSLWQQVLCTATVAVGACGLGAGLAGTLFLVGIRLGDRGLRDMSDAPTFFNLALLAAVFGSGLFAWLAADPAFAHSRDHLVSLLKGHPHAVEAPSLALAMVVAGLFLSYLPFSRMFHFAAKYFFYHQILWDERSMSKAGPMARDFAGYLAYAVTWSGEHVRPGRSWQEQVSPPSGTKEEPHDS